MRVIVYELKDGREEVVKVRSAIEERRERANAEREIRDPRSYVKGFRAEWRAETPGDSLALTS